MKHTNEENKKQSNSKVSKSRKISDILNERELNVETKELDESKKETRTVKTRLRTNTTINQETPENSTNDEIRKSTRMRTRSLYPKLGENQNSPDPMLIEDNAASIVKQLTKGMKARQQKNFQFLFLIFKAILLILKLQSQLSVFIEKR